MKLVAYIGFLSILVGVAGGSALGAENTIANRWQGTWQAANSKDCKELKCVAKKLEGTKWEATFTGVCNRRFSFQIKMRGRTVKDKVVFEGKTDLGKVNGGLYEWSGTIVGDVFTGRYESSEGKKGTFSMKPASASEAADASDKKK